MQFINGSYVNDKTPDTLVLADPTKPGTFALELASAKTATANGATVAGNSQVNAGGESLAVLVTVVVAAATGTTPTLVVNIQDAATAGGSYTTEGSSASITAAGSYQFFVPISNLFYRATWTIGGTTPSFNFAVFVTPFKFGIGV